MHTPVMLTVKMGGIPSSGQSDFTVRLFLTNKLTKGVTESSLLLHCARVELTANQYFFFVFQGVTLTHRLLLKAFGF